MNIYLIDDLGDSGEYAGFLMAHRAVLPQFTLHIFTHLQALLDAIHTQMPDVLLADMRFDNIPLSQLYGDIQGLAQTEAFCGNFERAEAQVRGMQGLLICRGLRAEHIPIPIILFASLPPSIIEHVSQTLAPIHIIEGLILKHVKTILEVIAR